MGINICLLKFKGLAGEEWSNDKYPDMENVPEWDSPRMAYDKDFLHLKFERVRMDCKDGCVYWRPKDFASARLAVNRLQLGDCHLQCVGLLKNRFHKILDLLEQNKDYWVFVSY